MGRPWPRMVVLDGDLAQGDVTRDPEEVLRRAAALERRDHQFVGVLLHAQTLVGQAVRMNMPQFRLLVEMAGE